MSEGWEEYRERMARHKLAEQQPPLSPQATRKLLLRTLRLSPPPPICKENVNGNGTDVGRETD